MAGGIEPQSYISKHFTIWNNAYLNKNSRTLEWDDILIHNSDRHLPPVSISTIPSFSVLQKSKYGTEDSVEKV